MQYLLDEICQFCFVLTVMLKYDIFDFVYLHQLITNLASLSDLISL